MTPLESLLTPGDDRLSQLWAACIRQAIKDYQAPKTDRKVSKQHRRTAEALLRKHGYLRPDGSIGPPV